MSRKSRGNTCVEEMWVESTTGPKVKAKSMSLKAGVKDSMKHKTGEKRERCHGNRGESKGWWLSTSDAEDKSRKELRGCAWQDGSLPGGGLTKEERSTREVKEETRSKDYKDTFIICT